MKPVFSFRPDKLARSLLFVLSAAYYGWLVLSGNITRIMHPRMIPWIVVATLIMVLIGLAGVLGGKSERHGTDTLSHYLPILFVFVMASLFLASGDLPQGLSSGIDVAALSANFERRDKAAEEAATAPLPSTIVFDDDRYWSLYNRLYDEPKTAAGREVVIQGLVSREKGSPAGSILVGRRFMWCCSADMGTIGLFATLPSANEPPQGAWVEVRGTLGTFERVADGKKELLPMIVAESEHRVDKGSASEIIFPF